MVCSNFNRIPDAATKAEAERQQQQQHHHHQVLLLPSPEASQREMLLPHATIADPSATLPSIGAFRSQRPQLAQKAPDARPLLTKLQPKVVQSWGLPNLVARSQVVLTRKHR